MSRIGRAPITLPQGVEIELKNNSIKVKGPKGTLEQNIPAPIVINNDGSTLHVVRPNDDKVNRSLHGLVRALVNNMVIGVTTGFTKELEIQGVGFRAQKQGTQLVMNLGYSHQVFFDENDDIKIDVPAPNKIIIKGIDKQKVGQYAAEVRSARPPEPYKGKGVRYQGEVVLLKEGKTGAKK